MLDAPKGKKTASLSTGGVLPLSRLPATKNNSKATIAQDTLKPLPIERFVARKDFWIGRLDLPDVSNCQK